MKELLHIIDLWWPLATFITISIVLPLLMIGASLVCSIIDKGENTFKYPSQFDLPWISWWSNNVKPRWIHESPFQKYGVLVCLVIFVLLVLALFEVSITTFIVFCIALEELIMFARKMYTLHKKGEDLWGVNSFIARMFGKEKVNSKNEESNNAN